MSNTQTWPGNRPRFVQMGYYSDVELYSKSSSTLTALSGQLKDTTSLLLESNQGWPQVPPSETRFFISILSLLFCYASVQKIISYLKKAQYPYPLRDRHIILELKTCHSSKEFSIIFSNSSEFMHNLCKRFFMWYNLCKSSRNKCVLSWSFIWAHFYHLFLLTVYIIHLLSMPLNITWL